MGALGASPGPGRVRAPSRSRSMGGDAGTTTHLVQGTCSWEEPASLAHHSGARPAGFRSGGSDLATTRGAGTSPVVRAGSRPDERVGGLEGRRCRARGPVGLGRVAGSPCEQGTWRHRPDGPLDRPGAGTRTPPMGPSFRAGRCGDPARANSWPRTRSLVAGSRVSRPRWGDGGRAARGAPGGRPEDTAAGVERALSGEVGCRRAWHVVC